MSIEAAFPLTPTIYSISFGKIMFYFHVFIYASIFKKATTA
jgi:hypothetical protein